MIHRKHQHEYLDNTKKSNPAFALSLAPVKKLAPKEVYDIEVMILHMLRYVFPQHTLVTPPPPLHLQGIKLKHKRLQRVLG